MTQQTPTTWNKNSIFRPFIKTVESGAQTTIFCAVEVFCYFQRISHYIFINNRASHLLPWCFCSRRALRASQADTIQTAGSFQRSFSVSSMKYTFDMNDEYLSSGMTHVWHALHVIFKWFLMMKKLLRETWLWGRAASKEDAARLWEISDQLTKVWGNQTELE